MNQRTVTVLSVAAIVVIVVGALAWNRLHPSVQLQSASQSPIVGKAVLHGVAPQFQVSTTNGPFDLNAATKPVFLEVFATWCPHCQRETVVLNKLYAAYKNRVSFVAVDGSDLAMDSVAPASQLDVLNFQERFKVQYPVAFDGPLTVANLYLQGGFPTIAIIDTKKTITYLNSGEVPYQDLATALNQSSGGKR
jgi:thiol-disulfide isomerase/thioredoxin